MSSQEEFNAVLDNDEYYQSLRERMITEKLAMIRTLAALTKRIIHVTADTGVKLIPQSVLTSLTSDLEIELCMRSMDEVDPNWKMKALEEMSKNPELLEQLLEKAAGMVSEDTVTALREQVEAVSDNGPEWKNHKNINTYH
jgi:hypothetical protein